MDLGDLCLREKREVVFQRKQEDGVGMLDCESKYDIVVWKNILDLHEISQNSI